MLYWKQLYGPVAKVWFGYRPVVWISDTDLGKRVCWKLLNRPSWIGDPLTSGPARLPQNKGLFASRDDLWRMLHKMWQPAFYAESVQACVPLMQEAAQQLCARLEVLAGRPVDLWREVGSLTMMTVGSAAYGIDFQTIDSPHQQQLEGEHPLIESAKHPLIESAKTLFAAAGAATGSPWQILALLAPPFFAGAVRFLAHVSPDANFRRVMQARQTLFSSNMQLLQQSREKLQQSEQARPYSSGPAGAPSSGGGSSSSSKRIGAIAPGSFLGLLLSATNSSTGHGLSDFQLCMQAATFTLAGYETTANTLTFCLFLLATHPSAEQKVVQEIKAAAVTAHSGGDASNKWYSRDLEQRLPYLCGVVNEALRLYPPGASVVREVGPQPLQLGDFTLPPHTSVFVNVYALHRDPAIWPRADEFLPERWLPGGEHLVPSNAAAYMPFGGGARMCIGFRFALQEIYVSLVELLGRFHFEVQWELMAPPAAGPPAPDTASTGGSAEGDIGNGCGSGANCRWKQLRLSNGFTLAPAGGVWVKAVPRGPN